MKRSRPQSIGYQTAVQFPKNVVVVGSLCPPDQQCYTNL